MQSDGVLKSKDFVFICIAGLHVGRKSHNTYHGDWPFISHRLWCSPYLLSAHN
jgi:hypothetical protein